MVGRCAASPQEAILAGLWRLMRGLAEAADQREGRFLITSRYARLHKKASLGARRCNFTQRQPGSGDRFRAVAGDQTVAHADPMHMGEESRRRRQIDK